MVGISKYVLLIFETTQVLFHKNLLIIPGGYPSGIIWKKLEIKILWVFMHNKTHGLRQLYLPQYTQLGTVRKTKLISLSSKETTHISSSQAVVPHSLSLSLSLSLTHTHTHTQFIWPEYSSKCNIGMGKLGISIFKNASKCFLLFPSFVKIVVNPMLWYLSKTPNGYIGGATS